MLDFISVVLRKHTESIQNVGQGVTKQRQTPFGMLAENLLGNHVENKFKKSFETRCRQWLCRLTLRAKALHIGSVYSTSRQGVLFLQHHSRSSRTSRLKICKGCYRTSVQMYNAVVRLTYSKKKSIV